jgi:predicted RNase H-like nuclease (RuvC/YqgF family)
MNSLKSWRWPLVLILFAAAGVAASVYRGKTNAGAAEQPQDVTSLERRISQLEQRLYTIEATLNRLDQQSRLSESRPAPSTSGRDVDYTLLRTEVETLQRRLIEVECGLVRLDERTLTPAAREARKRTGTTATDPCRLNADAPLRLSTRP